MEQSSYELKNGQGTIHVNQKQGMPSKTSGKPMDWDYFGSVNIDGQTYNFIVYKKASGTGKAYPDMRVLGLNG